MRQEEASESGRRVSVERGSEWSPEVRCAKAGAGENLERASAKETSRVTLNDNLFEAAVTGR